VPVELEFEDGREQEKGGKKKQEEAFRINMFYYVMAYL